VRFANLQPLVVSIALAILTFEYLAQQHARLLNIPGLSPVGPCLRLKPDPLAAPPELAHEKPALGHVWTAPWQELSDVGAAWVGCGHVSSLFVRRIWPLALMLCADRVPIESTHFKVR